MAPETACAAPTPWRDLFRTRTPLPPHPPLQSVLLHAEVIPLLVAIIRRFNKYSTSFMGSAMPWPPEHRPEYNSRVAETLAGALLDSCDGRMGAFEGPALGMTRSLAVGKPLIPPCYPPRADSADADDRNKSLPRLAQMCVQSIANLACDNEPDKNG